MMEDLNNEKPHTRMTFDPPMTWLATHMYCNKAYRVSRRRIGYGIPVTASLDEAFVARVDN